MFSIPELPEIQQKSISVRICRVRQKRFTSEVRITQSITKQISLQIQIQVAQQIGFEKSIPIQI